LAPFLRFFCDVQNRRRSQIRFLEQFAAVRPAPDFPHGILRLRPV
jgi:hypothetical protein